MRSTYVVCIPSYHRSHLCRNKTLAMLHANGIEKNLIHVFVADSKEHDEYRRVLNPNSYHRLHIGLKGLVPQREYIERTFPAGTHIVFLDDDIESVDMSLSPMFKHYTLDAFIRHAFSACVESKTYIWGIYPVFNPFFRQPRKEMTTNLSYIVGAFYGVITRPQDRNLRLTYTREDGQKEDVERTIRYFQRDGRVLRFNKIGFKTRYYGKSGGLGTFEERLEAMQRAARHLHEAYPEYGTIHIRKTGMTEFKLKALPQKSVPSKQNT